jgi:hypothetical protein
LNGSLASHQGDIARGDEKALPRDILLAKARQYRESQNVQRRQAHPEQLSMDVENSETSLDVARRLANEIVKSPFDNRNLEVPAFLRRKQATRAEDENDNLPMG